MITCNRQEFVLLSEGTLLKRTADGKVYIGDTTEAHAAMKAHDAGQWVRLEEQGRYTYIKDGTEMTATDYKRHKKAGMK